MPGQKSYSDQDVTPRRRTFDNKHDKQRPFDRDDPNPADRDEIFHDPAWRDEDAKVGYRRI